MPTARFDELLRRHLEPTGALYPPGLRVWDAHTHLGVDEDGFTQSAEELLELMRAQGVERAFTFPLNDPDRHPAYRVPNDRVMAWAAASDGALVPFCRLDMTEARSPRPSGAWTPGRPASSSTPARRPSTSGRPG